MNQKLRQGLEKLCIGFDDQKIFQLETYADCVMAFNKSYNLMKAESLDELFVNHVLDSLAAFVHLKKIFDEAKAKKNSPLEIGDIGSGGGCPGIPLAVFFPEEKFFLVERMEKRCAFLSDALKKCGIKNAFVKNVRADELKSESFDAEVFRAFHPFDKKNTTLLLRLLKKGGTLAAYKARSEKIQAEMESVKFLVPSYEKIKICVPFLEDHERNLVVVKK